MSKPIMKLDRSEAKSYLRVDHSDDDDFIQSLIDSGYEIVFDTLRHPLKGTETERSAVLYSIAYRYEHREDADLGVMMKNIRSVLSAERKAAF